MNLVKATLLSFLVLAAPAAEAADVSLLYNGSVRAEMKDCGCKSLPLGGLARRAALIESISQDREVLLIDAGNLLGDPTRDTFVQSSFVAKHTAEIGYTTVGVGPYEFGHGIDAVQDIALASGLEFISANLTVNGIFLTNFFENNINRPEKIIGKLIGLTNIRGSLMITPVHKRFRCPAKGIVRIDFEN